MLASEVIASVAEVLNDNDYVTWTQDQLLGWLNEGQRIIALVRPDSSQVTEAVSLVPGTRQTLAAGSVRLMTVIRNMGNDGLTPGQAIRLVERATKDELDPDWHAAEAGTVIDEYIYDDRVPLTFYVSPPVSSTESVYVDLTRAATPSDVPDVDTAINVEDQYVPALKEYMWYGAYARESEESPNYARAERHFANCMSLLGVKTGGDALITPKTREHLQ